MFGIGYHLAQCENGLKGYYTSCMVCTVQVVT